MKYKTTRFHQGRHPPLDMRRRFDTVNSYHLQEHEAMVANPDSDDFAAAAALAAAPAAASAVEEEDEVDDDDPVPIIFEPVKKKETVSHIKCDKQSTSDGFCHAGTAYIRRT